MQISIVGGIFDKPPAYRSKHSISPETVLAAGLRERGWRVTVSGHRAPLPAGADLVHVHHFGRAALRAAFRGRRVPFVFTTHDPFAMNGLGAGWKRRFTDALVLRRADAVVAMTNIERHFLGRRYALTADSVTVIPNGIDTSVFDRRPEPQPDSEDWLLFVGQLQRFKGLDYLLYAMPAVRDAFPRVRLRIVYQTSALLDQYKNQAAALGIDGIVEFAGAKTATELAHLYSSAAVVVSPSLGECLSTVVLEAMCCGAPVVATDVGGIREQLDENTGVIVPPRDSGALARAVCRLLGNPAWCSAMGEAARRKARAEFSVRNMIDRHVRLYEELLGVHERAA